MVPTPGELVVRLVRSPTQTRDAAALVLDKAKIDMGAGSGVLATNSHSVSGLMRAEWTAAGIRRNQTFDWMLTEEDATAIRRRRP